VIAADRGREFGWLVGDEYVRWVYSMQAEGDGTRLTEAWELLPNGVQLFHNMYGENAEAAIAARIEVAHATIAETLRTMKRIVESD
jgi:hypothetical protein